MDTTTFKKKVRDIFSQLDIREERMAAAELTAFLEMAHYIDLPDAEADGEKAITSGTNNYALNLTSGADIDRITSAVFYATTVQSPLEEWGVRRYRYHYYGTASGNRGGTPTAFCYFNDEMLLWPEPNLSGTVYFTCQQVLSDLTDFPDNHYPLMVALLTKRLYAPGDREWWAARRDSMDLIKSYKGRMHPKKDVMEMTSHRAKRMEALNAL